jgi:Tol biopolymer transport system component
MRQGPLPLLDVLNVSIQVASALAEAHRAGIIHRDVKPENVIVRADGLAKVVDFGLAKAIEREIPTLDPEAPTEALRQTAPGLVLGTYAYMSPEQARGVRVDERSDLFSLGVMMYEMTTARAPFTGTSGTDVLVSILTSDPPTLHRFAPGVPNELGRIVSKAIAKDAEERYQTAKDLLADLKRLKRAYETPQVASQRRNVATLRVAAVLTALTALAGGTYVLVQQRRVQEPTSPESVIPVTSFPGIERSPALSPDGRQIAYVRTVGLNTFDLYVQMIGAGEPLQLTRTPVLEMSPTWSPDGRFIAFIRGAGAGKGLYVIPALGGTERLLTSFFGWDANALLPQAVDWSRDGNTIAFVDKTSGDEPWSVFLVSVDTGQKHRLTTPPASFFGDAGVAFSPDGLTVAFTRMHQLGSGQLARVPVTGGDPVLLTTDNVGIAGFVWTRGGSELVFVSGRLGETKIGRIPATGGPPIPLAIGEGAMDLSVSGDRLVFSRFSFDTDIWHLKLWKDSVPAVLPISSTREDGGPQFSPDGQKIAFHSQRSGPSGIWVSAVDGSNALQVTGFDGVEGRGPRWSPDGKRLAFTARVGGDPEIYIVDAAGGNAQRLTVSSGEDSNPSWSADGQWIYFGSIRSGRTEIWKVSPSGGAAVQVTQNGGDGPVCFTGGYMYYRKGHPRATIFRVGVDGGAEEQVFERRVWWNSWAIGERGVYFFTSRTSDRTWEAVLAMFDFSDRAVKDVAVVRRGPDTQQPMSVGGLALSPDESSILYDGRSRFDFDLMMVEGFR